jgi:hypothetical protein
MKLITVATHNDGYFKWLKQSCEKYRYHLNVLGYDEKWQGFNWRLQKLLIFLKQLKPYEIVCCIDAFDVIMLRDSTLLTKKFHEIHMREKCKIIIAKEVKDKIDELWGTWQFGININAGTYIGYAKDIIEILEKAQYVNNKPEADDQILLGNIAITYPQDIYIDKNCEIFLTISQLPILNRKILDTKHLQVHNKELYYKGIQPFLLHVPSNVSMVDVIEKLGYHITNEEVNNIKTNAKTTIMNKFLHHFTQPKNLFLILFICILIIACIFGLTRRKI